MTTAVGKWPACTRLLAVAPAGQLPTAPTPLLGTRPEVFELPPVWFPGSFLGRGDAFVAKLRRVGSTSRGESGGRTKPWAATCPRCPRSRTLVEGRPSE
jgi:hypothetical protein